MRLQANLLLAALQAWPHARNQPDFPLTMIIAFVAATAVAIALAPLFLWQMVCVTYAQEAFDVQHLPLWWVLSSRGWLLASGSGLLSCLSGTGLQAEAHSSLCPSELPDVLIDAEDRDVADDATTAEMFKSMWNGIGVTDEKFFIKDHLEHTLKFIEDARQHWEYRAFQVELDGKPIGTAACQVFHALYPSIIVGSDRKIGYIWGVYTAPEHRRQSV
eukprot:jgi/Astpho2/9916/fgenesh1_pg.00152_%23_32_t